MKASILALAVMLMAAFQFPVLRAQEAKPSAFAVATKYTCVMHPEVISDKPGKCPKCGMKLVPIKPKASPPPKQHGSHNVHLASGHRMANGMPDMQMAAHQMSMQSSISIADP